MAFVRVRVVAQDGSHEDVSDCKMLVHFVVMATPMTDNRAHLHLVNLLMFKHLSLFQFSPHSEIYDVVIRHPANPFDTSAAVVVVFVVAEHVHIDSVVVAAQSYISW